MKYFDLICNIIATALGIFGLSLFLFVVIRDKIHDKNDKSNGNKGKDNGRGHENIW